MGSTLSCYNCQYTEYCACTGCSLACCCCSCWYCMSKPLQHFRGSKVWRMGSYEGVGISCLCCIFYKGIAEYMVQYGRFKLIGDRRGRFDDIEIEDIEPIQNNPHEIRGMLESISKYQKEDSRKDTINLNQTFKTQLLQTHSSNTDQLRQQELELAETQQ